VFILMLDVTIQKNIQIHICYLKKKMEWNKY
jgi:hypothetical protein